MSDIEPRRVLLVDDDASVLSVTKRVLERGGFTVTASADGAAAMAALGEHTFSVIVTDIQMGEMSGLDFLRAVRARGLDIPVIMMTGGPSLQTALESMEHGAYRYLLKPVSTAELVQTVTRASLLSDLGKLKREAIALQGQGSQPQEDFDKLNATFSRALDQLHMVFQPIVSMRTGRTVGFEALARSSEPEMRNPLALFEAAGVLARTPDLSRAIYAGVAKRAPEIRQDVMLFVNVHPPDLLDPVLHGQDSPLAPEAGRVVLEMTERASLDRIGDIGPVIAGLRGLQYRLAVDDLGTGYAGLSSFTLLQPEFVKLDRSLITNINVLPTKQRVVRAMYALCEELGMRVISEGVETKEERDTLLTLGADLLQGYFFARPAVEIVEPVLEAIQPTLQA